jgi:hypothetical protein
MLFGVHAVNSVAIRIAMPNVDKNALTPRLAFSHNAGVAGSRFHVRQWIPYWNNLTPIYRGANEKRKAESIPLQPHNLQR